MPLSLSLFFGHKSTTSQVGTWTDTAGNILYSLDPPSISAVFLSHASFFSWLTSLPVTLLDSLSPDILKRGPESQARRLTTGFHPGSHASISRRAERALPQRLQITSLIHLTWPPSSSFQWMVLTPFSLSLIQVRPESLMLSLGKMHRLVFKMHTRFLLQSQSPEGFRHQTTYLWGKSQDVLKTKRQLSSTLQFSPYW